MEIKFNRFVPSDSQNILVTIGEKRHFPEMERKRHF
jgi:hypothetical protein